MPEQRLRRTREAYEGPYFGDHARVRELEGLRELERLQSRYEAQKRHYEEARDPDQDLWGV